MLHSSHSYNACSGRCFGSYATSVKELFLKQPLRLLSKWSLRPSKVNTVNEIKILTTKNHHKIWFFFFIFLLFFFFLLFLCKSKILIVFLVSLKSPSFMTHHMSSIAKSKSNHFFLPKHIEPNDNHNDSSLAFENSRNYKNRCTYIPFNKSIQNWWFKIKHLKTPQNLIYTFKAPRTQNQIIKLKKWTSNNETRTN